jgi:FAD/FMN-containing dehydrogenase/Fe-S oxidoreductase
MIRGDVYVDPYSLGRYATDASIYQMQPLGVVIPKTVDDLEASISFARENGVSILPRGGGTSQCGQTVGNSLVIDQTKYLNKIISLDVARRKCVVEPGVVLDELNRALKQHGLWFPVDVSTASRATIGGMAGNNSCGGRSLRYGTMRDNVVAIDAILASGEVLKFDERDVRKHDEPGGKLKSELLALGDREADEIAARFPKLLRRVGGYNIDALVPAADPVNFSHLLVGSEGTLAYFTWIELELSPLPGAKLLSACHFPNFRSAMEAAQHIVDLGPLSVELVDDTMIALAREIPLFRDTVRRFVKGDPEALLLVEFAEDDPTENQRKVEDLDAVMGELGYSFSAGGRKSGGTVVISDPVLQNEIAELRKAGLNIIMSMKEEGKPVSFVEDCAVALPDLADYTAGLTEIFERHGTKGTWYAHASVGCLHVRPVLNVKQDRDVKTMRAIAEECFDLVQSYKGSHSGEHGDGILRSEFHQQMFGSRIVNAFNEVKSCFDPDNTFNPHKIVQPHKMDDRDLFRYPTDYQVEPFETQLDWSAWAGAGGGFQGAVEMCNNNGACRKLSGGVMCPSFRVTRNERDVVRGRANTLRLAISGQLGAEALTSYDMMKSLSLCVSCKGCKRECPTGVDMARMKIEVLSARNARYGLSFADRLVGYLPKYAPYLSKFPMLANGRNNLRWLAALTENKTGISRHRELPTWSSKPFRDQEFVAENPDVILFADTFNRYFSPEVLRAAAEVLQVAGMQVQTAVPLNGKAPLDCGRTFLSVGCVDEARLQAQRLISSLLPHVRKGVPVIGLEPASLLGLRDEIPALLPGVDANLVAKNAMLFEEFFATDSKTREVSLRSLGRKILLHGHCHQKAFDALSRTEEVLNRIPGAEVTPIETSCCGMAGAFGYGKDTAEISLKMAEQSLFPAIRAADPDCLIAASGFSCRHQISSGTDRNPLHVAQILRMALD